MFIVIEIHMYNKSVVVNQCNKMLGSLAILPKSAVLLFFDLSVRGKMIYIRLNVLKWNVR